MKPRSAAASSATPSRPATAPRSAAPGRSARQGGPTTPATGDPPAAPDLTDRQRRHLRGLAHELKPVIRLGGAGLTEAVARETARALHDHELIKVKAASAGDRVARDALFADLAHRTGSALIHRIGNVAVLYRPRADLPKILIPDRGPPSGT